MKKCKEQLKEMDHDSRKNACIEDWSFRLMNPILKNLPLMFSLKGN